MRILLQRLGPCIVGYLWAAFIAAIALTIMRATRDISNGAMSLADLVLAVPYFSVVMTAAIVFAASVPALIAIVIGEVFLGRHEPVRLGYSLIAGMAVGFFLAMEPGLPISSTFSLNNAEALFRIASGGIGGLAFHHFSNGTGKSGVQPA
ncbi:MAG: hypothetical protein BGN83_00560 [Rhizobium sp. 63-7]|nr:MAG: hypothetical protein BGN83_00560 [Rhizobium sp. 63-7]